MDSRTFLRVFKYHFIYDWSSSSQPSRTCFDGGRGDKAKSYSLVWWNSSNWDRANERVQRKSLRAVIKTTQQLQFAFSAFTNRRNYMAINIYNLIFLDETATAEKMWKLTTTTHRKQLSPEPRILLQLRMNLMPQQQQQQQNVFIRYQQLNVLSMI